MATLESEEFDALLTVLTGDNQISDMGAYLMGESYIRTEEKKPKEEKPEEEKQKAEKPKEEKPKEEAKAAEKASVATPKETPTEEKKASAPKEEKKAPKPAPAPVQKSKAEIAAEKQARFKDALQKQMELQVQKQQERQKKQQEKQQEKQSQKVFVPKTGLHNDQPMTTVTTLDEKSSRVAGTRVVDTRSSGNVDLSKYDEKLEGFVDTSKKAFAGGTQKLKKQNKNSQLEGNKGGKNGKNQNQNNQLDRFRHQQQKAKDAPCRLDPAGLVVQSHEGSVRRLRRIEAGAHSDSGSGGAGQSQMDEHENLGGRGVRLHSLDLLHLRQLRRPNRYARKTEKNGGADGQCPAQGQGLEGNRDHAGRNERKSGGL